MPYRLPFLDESAPSILADGLLRASDFLQVGSAGELLKELKGLLPFLRQAGRLPRPAQHSLTQFGMLRLFSAARLSMPKTASSG